MTEDPECRHGNDPATCPHCASDGLDWLRRLGEDDDADEGGE